MRIQFLERSAAERADFIREAAVRRGLAEPIMEKDFWVSWMLGVVFQCSSVGPHVVFKGGTSLSKVARAIERFSEDIDLSLAPEFVGVTAEQIASAGSRTQRAALMKSLEEASARVVRERVLPAIEEVIRLVLGRRTGGEPWLDYQDDELTGSPVILFRYPTAVAPGYPYLTRYIKLEFGSLTDQRPTTASAISPWVADEFPALFTDWRCEVVALDAQRTFWEKATILHREAHRAPDSPMPARYSRHYSDMAALADHAVGASALQQDGLRERVVDWKANYFASAWARYDLAVPGTFKLVPPDERLGPLRADYLSMRDMFLGTPLDFDRVVERLRALERTINSSARSSA